MDGEGSANGGDKVRDYVGLLQDCFQGMLQQMTDLLGRIQRDAAIDPSTDPGYELFKYEEIPEAAKMLVHQVMVIDALIGEAEEKTNLGSDPSKVLEELKAESDAYERGIAELPEMDAKAELWLGRVNNVLEMVSQKVLGLEDEEEDVCV